jgi:hypothetical protein
MTERPLFDAPPPGFVKPSFTEELPASRKPGLDPDPLVAESV